jgi:Mg2+/Co2+ transporter CorB
VLFYSLTVVGLIGFSAFCAASETGLMSINRYKVRHLIKRGNRRIRYVAKLLERPDRLLGMILIGNTFANIVASAIATLAAAHVWGDRAIPWVTAFLTLIVLIFAEVAPKTWAALHPEKTAYLCALPLLWLMKIIYPLVWMVNMLANGFLRLFGTLPLHKPSDHLSSDELKTVVLESTGRIPVYYQEMLLRVLELERVTVEMLMIPRNSCVGLDLNAPWLKIVETLTSTTHTELPVYRHDMDNLVGILKVQHALALLHDGASLSSDAIASLLMEPLFVMETAPIHVQLFQFKKEHRRMALVVDEYGDITGLITIEQLLAEIVGEFSNQSVKQFIYPQADGSIEIYASINVRDLNRLMRWHLPTEGPITLSGLILEYLETIPDALVGLRLLNEYPMDIMTIEKNLIGKVRVYPQHHLPMDVTAVNH